VGLTMLQRKPDSGLGNIRSSPADPSRNIDWVLLAGLALLTTAGCFIVYSATRTLPGVDPYTYVTRQVIFAIIAAVVMFVVMTLDYEWLHDHWRPLYFFTVVSLLLLLVLGRLSGETMISFDIGPINIQPAEFAKVTVLLAIASFVADEESERVTYARFLGTLIIVAIPTVLVLAQPDLGGATVLLSCAMGVLLVAGAKIRYILTISMLTLLTLGAAYLSGFVNDYQLRRIRVLFDQDNPDLANDVFQVRNAIRAAGTGGWFGKGWLQGDLINGRDVPVVWADFPLAAVGEQFGLVGCGVLLLLFAIVLFRIWRIAGLSKDMLGTYICAGAFTMLLWQLFQNVAMTTGIMPVTGLPMPFISYGGSGLITYFAIFGLVQSVHMRRMR
jgi:rod shape determining protein RodA